MFDNLTVIQRMALKDALKDRYFKCKWELQEMMESESSSTSSKETIENAYDYSVDEINAIVEMLQEFGHNFSKVNRDTFKQ